MYHFFPLLTASPGGGETIYLIGETAHVLQLLVLVSPLGGTNMLKAAWAT